MSYLELRNLCKTYMSAEEGQAALRNVCLEVQQGEFLSVLGPSGSGKSTLMNIIGCLDVPTSGEVIFRDRNISRLNQHALAQLRCHEIGFVFQQFHLLSKQTALQNVELPMIYAGIPQRERRKRAKELLVRMGLEDRMDYYPGQMSGGQQQRTAIARALTMNPSLILADEPTGALDQANGRQVMELFKEMNAEGHTVIMITHDLNIAAQARRIVRILDGELTEGGAA